MILLKVDTMPVLTMQQDLAKEDMEEIRHKDNEVETEEETHIEGMEPEEWIMEIKVIEEMIWIKGQ